MIAFALARRSSGHVSISDRMSFVSHPTRRYISWKSRFGTVSVPSMSNTAPTRRRRAARCGPSGANARGSGPAIATRDADVPAPLALLPQPRLREPVGYHSQVQPEHLQAVLPRVRQGHRLREGACRVEQSRPNPLRLFSGAFPPIRRRFEPSRRPRDARVPPRRRSGSFEPRAQRASRRTPFRGSSATARHPETQTDLSPRSFFPPAEQLSLCRRRT